ncbi:MAG: ABC transporter ATP-binding protein [Anaerolineae bacterium]
MNTIAKLTRVSYMYPRSEELVLRDVSLDIHKGEFLGIIGPTGAGKTTLCLTLNGIVPQFYGGRFFGHVTVAGLDSLEHPISALAQHVGIVFEDPETQITATSVENEIAFALENLRVPREEIRARIPQVLEAVRLEGMEKKHPYELSGGEKQRLAIAAALALRPDLLVLDEPTSQLDPHGTQEIFATIRELNRELGVTIVMTSHAAEEMAEYADRVALLSQGTLVQTGRADDVYGAVSLLHAHHLRPPQVASTFYLIQGAGFPIAQTPVRFGEAVEQLEALVGQGDLSQEDRGVRLADRSLPGDVLRLSPNPRSGELTCSPCEPRQNWLAQDAPLLSVEDLVHVYADGTQALRGVSMDVDEGEYVLIIGQNGAGKSTLVKHFLRLLEPTTGTVRVGGTDIRNLTVSELARRIGYVAQNPDNQIFNATVEDEVAFALRNAGRRTGAAMTSGDMDARVSESLEAMGLLAVRDHHPLALPRGDRARVVIAAILAMRPEIVIFDEPTTGQDYRGAKYILDISRQLHEMGKTVIVITHHLYLMPDYAERVVVMGKGTVLADGPIREVFHATDILDATYLTPPQAVLLAQAVCRNGTAPYPLLTPEEVAACVTRLSVEQGRGAPTKDAFERHCAPDEAPLPCLSGGEG